MWATRFGGLSRRPTRPARCFGAWKGWAHGPKRPRSRADRHHFWRNRVSRGTIEMPMALGLVGGAHQTRPLAHIALKILGVKGAQELAEAAVTVGLAQNMAAIPALANLS
ncbi:hypothetical protein [Mesorhizobium sp. M1066]